MIKQDSTSTKVLLQEQWQKEVARHHDVLDDFVQAHLKRRHHSEKHPVHDFLFEYFNFRPAQLLRWSPGIDRYLQGTGARDFLEMRYFSAGEQGVGLYPHTFPEGRKRAAKWILELLEATQNRPPFIGCMGLHEWAMVYDKEDIRHPQYSLRMPHEHLVEFVNSQSIFCTHFDAYRFFSKSAIPLNRLKPTADAREKFEQPGCLHANMDLYKWCYKLYPWTSGTLLRDTFTLAIHTREIDMRASPYDLRTLGYEPILIETHAGKTAYADEQRKIFERGQAVRGRLIDELRSLLKLVN
jgi:hypothetical protein